jgi:hypothetical protein
MGNDPTTSIDSARWLASAIAAEPSRAVQWEPAELSAMLAHQLAAPIRADLEKLSSELSAQFDKAGASPTETFGQLFTRPDPNLKLLQLVKDFSKRAIAANDGSIPEELGAVLYYAAISCALLRCGGQRISGLDDQTLKICLTWVLSQTWLDASLRPLFAEVLPVLKPSS